ncbi:MAG TPA: DUF11 domain-containing protein, partial [Herpetosiphonaceae bacterium]
MFARANRRRFRIWAAAALLFLLAAGGGYPAGAAGPARGAAISPEPAALAPGAADAVADDAFWNNRGLVAGANNSVRALALSGTTLFAGGAFDRISGIPANRIASWDGQRWSPLGAGVSGLNAAVEDLDASVSNVYAVGSFTSAGGAAADSIAYWSIVNQEWVPMATSVNGTVDAVMVVRISNADVVFVGGSFTQIDGVNANRIARWSNGAWSALGSGVNGRVFDISFNPSTVTQIAVGGTFTSAGGAAANNVAIWNGTAWSALGSGSSNGVTGGSPLAVRFVDFRGTNFVVVGGRFTTAGTVANVNGSALWRGANTWEAFTGRGVIGGDVRAIFEDTNNAYAAGTFVTPVNPNGSGVANSSFLSQWDGNVWNAIPRSPDASVLRAKKQPGQQSFYLAGSFTRAGGIEVGFVTLYTPFLGGQFGAPEHVFFPLGGSVESSASTSRVMAIQPSGASIFVGGAFELASDQFISNIARFDPAARTWNQLAGGANDRVRALALRGTDLIVAGEFTRVGGPSGINAARIAVWNGTTWSALATAINGDIHALAVSGSNIFVGGTFTAIDGVPANRVARWDGAAWSAVGTGTDGPVNALLFKDSTLYAGGLFANAGGAPASNIARWNGTAWSALGSGADDEVLALANLTLAVGVGGRFNSAGGVAGTSAIARFRPGNSTWEALGSGTDGIVFDIEQRGNDIYAGGLFNRMLPDLTVNHVARWNGTSWNPLGSGTAGANLQGSQVDSLAVAGDSLYVGGRFLRAGDQTSHHFAEWQQPEVDLNLSLLATPSNVPLNTQFTYRAVVTNQGSINATSVVYDQSIASSLTIGAPATSQGTCSFPTATTLRCAIGTLAPGRSATITLPATPTATGLVGATGAASSPATEAFPNNNTRIVFIQVSPPGNPLPTISSLSPASFVRQQFDFEDPPQPVRITVNGTGFVPNSRILLDGVERAPTFV